MGVLDVVCSQHLIVLLGNIRAGVNSLQKSFELILVTNKKSQKLEPTNTLYGMLNGIHYYIVNCRAFNEGQGPGSSPLQL